MTTETELGGGPDVSGAMQPHGFYNRHSLPQHEAAAFAEPLLRQAARAIRPQCDILRDPIWAKYRETADRDAFAAAYLNFSTLPLRPRSSVRCPAADHRKSGDPSNENSTPN